MEFLSQLVSPQMVGNSIPIICNQENFILKSNSYRIFQAVPGFHFLVNPAVKDIQDRGRPKNGMFIGFPDSIRNCVTDVSPKHWRIQAIVVKSRMSRTLIINTYFPTDKREYGNSNSKEDDGELIELIEIIKNVIETNDCEAVVWAGDINADFDRNTKHSTAVKEAVEEARLLVSWDTFPVDFTCSYEREGVSFTSILDHFFLSEELFVKVTDAGVIHHPDNSSDHEPVFCVLEAITLSSSSSQGVTPQPRPSWKKANKDEKDMYRYMLDRKLEAIMVPTQISECKDPHCKNEEHLEAVDWFCAEVVEAVQNAGEETLP